LTHKTMCIYENSFIFFGMMIFSLISFCYKKQKFQKRKEKTY